MLEHKQHVFTSLKTARILTKGEGRVLQLENGGEKMLLVGDEIRDLATLIRQCSADVVAEIFDTEVHPCPHCGGEARIAVVKWRDKDKKAPKICRIQCLVCGARTRDVEDETGKTRDGQGDHDAKRRAIKLWNVRA